MAELISIREYGRRIGCSDTAIRKAIKAGKIVKGVVQHQGRPHINPEVANMEWKTNFDPSYSTGSTRNKKLNEQMLPASEVEQSDEPVATGKTTRKSLADIKRDTAEVKLHIAAIELKEKKGQLVDKEKVYKALFAAGQEVRTTFQSIPDRTIDEILAAPSRNDAHSVLFNAIADALEQLSEIANREIVIR